MLATALPYIVIAGLVLALVFLYRSLQRDYARTPVGEPHDCAVGSFLPQMRTKTRYLGQRDGKEFGIVVFEGLYCSACEKELFCAACAGTPDSGSVLGSEEDRYSILECCDHPQYRVRSGVEVEEASNVIPFPGAKDDDLSN